MNDSPEIEHSDETARIVYLEVPPSKVVLLQAYFELYEGLGVVRTLNLKKSLLCVITTKCQLVECIEALNSVRDIIGWRFVPIPPDGDREHYLGYFSHVTNDSKI